MKRFVLVLLAVVLFSPVMCAWAIDAQKLEKDMWSFAAITAYLDVVMHPGVPHHTPGTMARIGEKLDELDAVKKSIYNAIQSAGSMAELDQARGVVDGFKKMHGFEKDVGHFVGRWVEERAKFLETQGG
ncbi:MAG TPA: hypothetical protein PLU72_09975 [Candidatus Ozemobacteraceae bacterium]|nr:hypothetical protein [Candidatus Ozemobacteraceae bacterium]HQG27009.1 hypothetical protein [Candidatus Ozemobacteraceae bacterium]